MMKNEAYTHFFNISYSLHKGIFRSLECPWKA